MSTNEDGTNSESSTSQKTEGEQETVATPPVEGEKTEKSLLNDNGTDTTDKAADDKAAKEDKTEDDKTELVPLKADDFKFADNFEVDKELLGKFVEFANEKKLTQAEAQDYVNFWNETVAEASERASEENHSSWQEMQNKWKTEVKAMPEFSGTREKASFQQISQLITQVSKDFGEDEAAQRKFESDFRTAFDITGAGNNPHVMRFFLNIAEKLVEADAAPAGPGNSGELSAADAMFPSMAKQQ